MSRLRPFLLRFAAVALCAVGGFFVASVSSYLTAAPAKKHSAHTAPHRIRSAHPRRKHAVEKHAVGKHTTHKHAVRKHTAQKPVTTTASTTTQMTTTQATTTTQTTTAVTTTDTATETTVSAPSTPSPPPPPPPAGPKNTVLPSISGDLHEGQTLTASPGTWTANAIRFSYQWYRCDNSGANCSALSGVTGTTYVATADDVNQTLYVSVVGRTKAGGATRVSSTKVGPIIVTPHIPTPPPGILTETYFTYQGQLLPDNVDPLVADAYNWVRAFQVPSAPGYVDFNIGSGCNPGLLGCMMWTTPEATVRIVPGEMTHFVFSHEMGHVFDYYVLAPSGYRNAFIQIFGLTWQTPHSEEMVADAYAWCAMLGSPPLPTWATDPKSNFRAYIQGIPLTDAIQAQTCKVFRDAYSAWLQNDSAVTLGQSIATTQSGG